MSWLETYQPLNGVRLNMVVDTNGLFTDKFGSSRGISNELDRQLLTRLRSQTDVIVTGGNTARVEKYGVNKHAKVAVISHNSYPNPEILTLTPPEGIDVATWCLPELAGKGFSSVLLEVGPSLAKAFLSADLVDEFLLTVSDGPVAVAEEVVRSLESKLNLVESHQQGATLFTKWRRGND